MKIIVAVKRVIDYEVDIQVNSEGTDVVRECVPMSMNPFDEVALEEAIRLKEAGIADSVLAVTLGDSDCQSVLKSALAMGANEALLVETDNRIEPLTVAKVLASLAQQESADLVLLGKQAIDNDANQTGQMTAALMGCGQGVFVSALSVDTDKRQVTAVRDTDYGTETLELPLPTVITAASRMNHPRFIALPQMMRAKRKTIPVKTLSEFGIENTDIRLKTMSIREPDAREPAVMLTTAEQVSDVITKTINTL